MTGYLVAFLLPLAAGAIAWAVERGRRAAAEGKVKDKDLELAAVQKKVENTEAALEHTNAELAQAKVDWNRDLASWNTIVGQRDARIAELEAELARVLDPRVVGERARRMLSEAGGEAGSDADAGHGRVPYGGAPR